MTMAERLRVHGGIEKGNNERFEQAATTQRMEEEASYVWYHDEYAVDWYKRFNTRAEAERAADKYNQCYGEEGHACVITEADYELMIEDEGPAPWQKPGMSVHDFF